MELLQYGFELEPDHPMDAVRARVHAKRALLDALPGLRWKAWLLSEPLPGRDQARSYAPLYLFDGMPAAVAFLCGGIYRGVTDAFGWTTPVHGPAVGPTPAVPDAARSCTLQTTALRDHGALVAAAQATAVPDDALGVARLLDIAHLQLRTYTFRAAPPQALGAVDAERVYEVVAVSSPARAR